MGSGLPVILAAGVAWGVAVLLTPVVRTLAIRLRVIDRPDGRLRQHADAIPRGGGVAMAVAYLAGLTCAVALFPTTTDAASRSLALAVLSGASVVLLTGLGDDLFDWRWGTKLAGQTVAALVAWLAGIRFTGIVGYEIHDPSVSLVLTVAWLVLCCNAFNLIDGLDGLAAGLGALASGTIAITALLQGNPALALATAPLVGALVGFLKYNRSPASIFLGDCGSLTIGFLLGIFAMVWSLKSTTLLGLTAPVLVLAVPLVDTVVSVARRMLAGRPVVQGDHDHIHHRLLARGHSPRRAAAMLYLLCVVGSVGAIVINMTPEGLIGLAVITASLTATWLLVRRLEYDVFAERRTDSTTADPSPAKHADFSVPGSDTYT